MTIFVMIGVSGSGKSTLAEKIHKEANAVLLSSDAIRAELFNDETYQGDNNLVFQTLFERLDSCVKSNKDVIVDATFLSRKDRKRFKQYKNKKSVSIAFLLMATDYETCIKNDVQRNRTVGKEVIQKQIKKFEFPLESEYDELYVFTKQSEYLMHIDKKNNEFISLATLIAKHNNGEITFDINNPHHRQLLFGHMVSAFDYALRYKFSWEICMAALLHDIGFLHTRQNDELGISHYYNHANVSAYILLTETTLPYKVVKLVNYHMLPYQKDVDGVKIFGEEFWNKLLMLNECDKHSM